MIFNYRYNKLEYYIVPIFLVFYAFSTSFQDYIFYNRMIGVLAVILIIGLLCIKHIYKLFSFNLSFHYYTGWVLLAILSVYNNQDIIKSTESRWILPIAGIVAFLFLKDEICWGKTFVTVVEFFVMIHTFFTIFFFIFKDLYLNYFIKVLPGDHEYLIGKFKEGSMPGITSHYSTNGIYLAIGFVFFSAIVLHNNNKSGKNIKLYLCQLFFTFYALFLTTKRAHILFGIISFVVMYYAYNSNRRLSRLFYIVIGAIVGIIVLLALSKVSSSVSFVIDRFYHGDSNGELTNGRVYFWKYAFEEFKTSPFIGIGWGGFKHSYYQALGRPYSSNSDYVDCHNVFIQLLCEQGIIGLSLFLIAIIGSIKSVWSCLINCRRNVLIAFAQHQKYLLISLGMQTFFVLYCLTGNCLYDSEIFFVYIISCALGYSTVKKIKGYNYQ